MQIKARFKSVFANPVKRVAEMMPELKQLRESMQAAVKSSNPLVAIVDFFNAVSKWHDRGISDLMAAFQEVNFGQHDETLKRLRILQAHFINAGRSQYGMNRTEIGQEVTAECVFLGDIYGLFTKPVSFWITCKDDKKGGWGFPNMEHLNAYDVVSAQARDFMKSHAEPMIRVIGELQSLAA